MRTEDRDPANLKLVLQIIDDLRRRSLPLSQDTLASDRDERDLAAFRIAMVGETCGKLSQSLRDRHMDLPWRDMKGMRNLLVNAYGDWEIEFIWSALQNDLDPIATMCRVELARFD